jgi:hypothetical protein
MGILPLVEYPYFISTKNLWVTVSKRSDRMKEMRKNLNEMLALLMIDNFRLIGE